MYKPGRGGGRGGGRRPSATPPHGRGGRGRGAAVAGAGTLSAAAVPQRGGRASTSASSATGRDESFRLEFGSGPVDFAAIIRLVPGLVEEIRRAEDAGLPGARIKFAANTNNTAENVVEVGGKEFRFTWSSERGDLCNIFEEHRHGDDGNGLLVECGAAWRKVNVQRILDESTKNHVKMRSEEAERISKQRKSIVLDPANPTVKKQASVESNTRRTSWQKKDGFYNKRKTDLPHASTIAPPKTTSKAVKTPKVLSVAGASNSPLSTPEQSTPNISAFPSRAEVEKISDPTNDVLLAFGLNKDDGSKKENEISNTNSQVKPRSRGNLEKSVIDSGDLQTFLISTLSGNPKGMSLKALEKLVGDALPNSSMKIEAVIKNIATFHTSGRYILKAEFSGENSQQAPYNGNKRSPGDAIKEALNNEVNIISNENTVEDTVFIVDEYDNSEKIDVGVRHSIPFGDDTRASNDSNGKVSSSSESGSDSDSDSDSSGSGSDNSSTSRSHAVSGSGSGSDSDTEGSSSAKEGSDIVVDIISDDEKVATEQKPIVGSGNMFSSPREWTTVEVENIQTNAGRAHKTSSHIDLNKLDNDNDDLSYAVKNTDNFHSNLAEMPSKVMKKENDRVTKIEPKGRFSSIDCQGQGSTDEQILTSETLVRSELCESGKEHVNGKNHGADDSFKTDQSKVAEKSLRSKLKRSSVPEVSKIERTKRPKSLSAANDMGMENINDGSHGNPKNLVSNNSKNEWLVAETHTTLIDLNSHHISPATNHGCLASGASEIANGPGIQSEASARMSGKHNSAESVDGLLKHSNSALSFGRGKLSAEDDSYDPTRRKRDRHGKSVMLDEKMQKKAKETTENKNVQSLQKSVSVFTGPEKSLSSSYETDAQLSSQKDRAKKFDGRKKVLQREYSDLESGELHEPSAIDVVGRAARQFEANGLPKLVQARAVSSDEPPFHMSARSQSNALQSHNKSPVPNLNADNHVNHVGVHKTGQILQLNSSKVQKVSTQSREAFHKKDLNTENAMRMDRSVDAAGKYELGTMHVATLQQPDSSFNNEALLLKKGNKLPEKPKRVNVAGLSDEQGKKSYTGDNGACSRKGSDSLIYFYTKYDKGEPELRGPVKDFSQFQEYVQEFNEKYEAYHLLDAELKKIRNDFLEIQPHFFYAKSNDSEQYEILGEKIKEMYVQIKERHLTMKRVFFLLHEELEVIKKRIADFAEEHIVKG